MADLRARRWLCALYLVQTEVAQALAVVGSALAAEIRLAFWREAFEALLSGATVSHPALRILEDAPKHALQGVPDAIDARRLELDARPFATTAALNAHLEAADGPVALAALRLLAPQALSLGPSDTRGAARVLGLLRLLRARAALRAAGRDFLPRDWSGAGPEAEAADERPYLVREARGALNGFSRELALWPDEAFPAAAPGALLMAYAQNRRPSALERRARILFAAVRGRL